MRPIFHTFAQLKVVHFQFLTSTQFFPRFYSRLEIFFIYSNCVSELFFSQDNCHFFLNNSQFKCSLTLPQRIRVSASILETLRAAHKATQASLKCLCSHTLVPRSRIEVKGYQQCMRMHFVNTCGVAEKTHFLSHLNITKSQIILCQKSPFPRL